MPRPISRTLAQTVAPLAGSVDRNMAGAYLILADELSLPSRGAWIEIPRYPDKPGEPAVAPLAGSVDRNRSVSG